MANTITLKRRIGSVKNTRQITKAMELVAASKMRRAQEYATRSRAYREAAYDLLAKLNSNSEVDRHPLFTKRKVSKKLYILVTSNRGLAGAYDSNAIKLLTQCLQDDRKNKVSSSIITIGKKGAQFARRVSGLNLIAVYNQLPDQPTANDIRPLLNTVIDQYKAADVDAVDIIYTQFKSQLTQVVTLLNLLPAHTNNAELQAQTTSTVMNFEPDVETVIDQTGTRLIEAQLWQSILESYASEQSMRMLAMKNATDNASDLIDDLTLEFNTARQSAITQELAEISGGVEALAS